MAKRHLADDDLAAALAMLIEIETAVTAWEPEKAVEAPVVDTGAGGDNDAEPAGQAASREAAEADKPGVAVLVAGVDSVSARQSPLVRLARGLDDEIDTIIAQASDTEVLSFPEKLLRRLRLGRVPQDMRRRDHVLTARLVVSLERAATLIAALEAHKSRMKPLLSRIEDDLVSRIGKAKAIEDEAISHVTEQLAERQDVIEAAIRHEADCNSLHHKLSIELERGVVVLHALVGRQDLSLAEHFSSAAQDALAHVLSLSDRNMLAMREVERRKHGIDDNFRHRFNLAPERHVLPSAPQGQPTKTEQASA